MKTLNRIVQIEDIISEIKKPAYANTFDVSINSTQVLSTADFLSEIEHMHYNKSYVSHMAKEYDIQEFIAQWTIYKARHIDEWTLIFNNQSAPIENYTDYYDYTTVTPDITNENNVEYGRTSTNTNTLTDTTNYGKQSKGQTNSYDGELRDTTKVTDSGNDTRTNINHGGSSMGGKDTSTTTTTGTTTSEKQGYKNSPFENMQKAIEYSARFNLRDMIINGFCMEFLFYNNDNGGGDWYYGFLY